MTTCTCAEFYIPTCHGIAAGLSCANAGRNSVNGRTLSFLMADYTTPMRLTFAVSVVSSLSFLCHFYLLFDYSSNFRGMPLKYS